MIALCAACGQAFPSEADGEEHAKTCHLREPYLAFMAFRQPGTMEDTIDATLAWAEHRDASTN